jgi:apolipoprotein D and lipocalin family protein
MLMPDKRHLCLILILIGLHGCLSVPEGVEPVSGFDINRYLGTWHEIARLDHSFERGLTDVTAQYSLRDDGGINVINRGRDMETGKWEQAVGKAYFRESNDIAKLKVSFFGPFYGAYNVAKLDKDYSMALIIGPTLGYAWLLSRTREPDAALCDSYFAEATKLGIPREDWILIRTCD